MCNGRFSTNANDSHLEHRSASFSSGDSGVQELAHSGLPNFIDEEMLTDGRTDRSRSAECTSLGSPKEKTKNFFKRLSVFLAPPSQDKYVYNDVQKLDVPVKKPETSTLIKEDICGATELICQGIEAQKEMTVKLADLGNACFTDNHFTDRVQTRQYRAIEVILDAPYGTPIDVWSCACVAFEIATGDYLFEPEPGPNYTRREEHLGQMIDLLGPIPHNVIRSGKRKEFFGCDGSLKNIPKEKMRPWSLERVLEDKYKWSHLAAVEFGSFLRQMLKYDPAERATARQCLSHPWLSSD